MNKKMWNLYKDSKDGKQMIEIFNPEVDNLESSIECLFECAKKWGSTIEPQMALSCCFLLYTNLTAKNLLWENKPTRCDFEKFIEEFDLIEYNMDEEGDITFYDDAKSVLIKKNDYRKKASIVHILSVFLYYHYENFKPILLQQHFDIIQQNCDLLGIDIPPIPHTNDYKTYLMYYYDICEAMNEFQNKNKLTDAEFCACLYDFAPMLSDEPVDIDIPKPVNVWLTGSAGKKDFEYLDKLGKDVEYNYSNIWACNERTRKGDIIVVYNNSPRSYIHSIWQAKSAGIFNPFDFYHCRSTLCNGKRIPQITIKDLKKDKYFSQVPIVRRNLQGINGIELTAEDYCELLRLIEEKGGDISELPKLFEGSNIDFGEIKLEKDVEENILIPTLEKLGYTNKDWTRQLSLKVGRKEKAIPDFVFFPHGEKHFENAPMVIEAKLDMSAITEQQKAFAQGHSYAKMLRATILCICDKERIIIYKADKNGIINRNNPIYENHWKAIYSDDIEGAKLKKIIGREIIANT